MGSLIDVAVSAMRRWLLVAAAVGALSMYCAPLALAQDSGQQEAAATDDAATLLTPDELRVVVAPVAFYPDEVLAIVLPASTTGIQIVEAARFLDKQKTDKALKPDEDWDPSVAALVNYPDVIALLNADLDWTQKLGDAVLDQQADVMDTIQQVRAEAVASGYLKSDDKQVIVQEKETVVIQSADPEVIYVPQYDPVVVVEQSYASYPPPVYYNPYPPYYSPAATFFAGAVTGAAFAYAFNWGDDDINIGGWGGNDVNINTGDINIGNDVDIGNKFGGDRVRTGDGDKVKWNGDKNRTKRDRASEKRRDGTAGVAPANRDRAGGDRAAAGRDKAGKQRQAGQQGAKERDRSGLGGYEKGRTANKDSKRGNKSMQSGQGSSVKKKQSGGGGAAVQSKKRGGGQGAFSGSGGGGKKASAQKSRGQKSMGGKKPRKR